MNRNIIVIVIIGMICIFGLSILNQSNVEIVENCKVIKLQQQQIIRSENNSINTEIRYIIVTDKETFICESSLLNGKFNNSDIFFRLKEDSTYTFKVAGIGKSMVNDYRNILQIIK